MVARRLAARLLLLVISLLPGLAQATPIFFAGYANDSPGFASDYTIEDDRWAPTIGRLDRFATIDASDFVIAPEGGFLSGTFSYQAEAGSDVDFGNYYPSLIVTGLDARWRVTLFVQAAADEPWTLVLESRRRGSLDLSDDDAGSGRVSLGPVGVTKTGDGTLFGSLDLTNAYVLQEAGGGSLPFDEFSDALITGVGTGSIQTLDLAFSFLAEAESIVGAGATEGGDEAAFRMGEGTRLSEFGAGLYPGAGDRVQEADGLFLSVQIVPEPATGTLLAAGLVALGAARRRRPRPTSPNHRPVA